MKRLVLASLAIAMFLVGCEQDMCGFQDHDHEGTEGDTAILIDQDSKWVVFDDKDHLVSSEEVEDCRYKDRERFERLVDYCLIIDRANCEEIVTVRICKQATDPRISPTQ